MQPEYALAVVLDEGSCPPACPGCRRTELRWSEQALDRPTLVVARDIPLGVAVGRAIATHDAVLVQSCAAHVTDAQMRALAESLRTQPRLTAGVAPMLQDGNQLFFPLPLPNGGWGGMPRASRAHLPQPGNLDLADAPVMMLAAQPLWASGVLSELPDTATLDDLLAAARARGYRLEVVPDVVARVRLDDLTRPYAEFAGDAPSYRNARRDRLDASLRLELGSWRCASLADDQAPKVLVDARGIPDHFNGTQQLAMALLDQLVMQNPRVDVLVTEAARSFHALGTRWGTKCVTSPDWTDRYDHAFKIDQPWSWTDWALLHAAAPTVSAYVLDVIAWDTMPSDGALGHLWQAVGQTADALAFLSGASAKRFDQAFAPPKSLHRPVVYPSLKPSDYLRVDSGTGSTVRDVDVLVVGNGYAHKDLAWAMDFLQAAFPSANVQAVGGSASIHGRRSNEEVAQLYRRAQVVVYPSHYEGFGLPIMEALAHGARVLVRSSDLNDELAERLGAPAWDSFTSAAELVDAVKNGATRRPPDVLAPHDWATAARELNDMFVTAVRGFSPSTWLLRDAWVKRHA